MHSELRSLLQSGLQLGLAVDHADLAVQSFLFLTCIAKCLAAGAAEAGSRARSATLCHVDGCHQCLRPCRSSWRAKTRLGAPSWAPSLGWQLCLQLVPSESLSHSVSSSCSCSWGYLMGMEHIPILHADDLVCCMLLQM